MVNQLVDLTKKRRSEIEKGKEYRQVKAEKERLERQNNVVDYEKARESYRALVIRDIQ